MKWQEAIPWIIAILGWIAAHLLSEARERRKEIRSQIEKIHEKIAKLEKDGRSFHLNAEYSSSLALDITGQISGLERALLRTSGLSMDSLLATIIGLRRSITLQNFDKSSFKTQIEASEIMSNINHAALDLEDEIEHQYRIRYPSTFPYFKFFK